MGWSCSAAAGKTLEAIEAFSETSGFESSNCLSKKTFLEIDRVEHDDGKITGEVIDFSGRKIGDAVINADGSIGSMPTLDIDGFCEWCLVFPRWKNVGNMVKKAIKAPVLQSSFQ